MNNKVLKIFEIIILFIGLPLLYYFDRVPGHKSIPLLVVFTLMLIILIRSKDFDTKQLGNNGFKNWRLIILRFLIVATILTAVVLIFLPGKLFIIIKQRWWLWVLIVIFYPLWSAYPQELIYRAFFVYRYGDLFKNKTVMAITNAALFAFLHIIFKNWIAVVATFAGGYMFMKTYLRSKSLIAVSAEHAIYGDFIFTIGLGSYFYRPDF